MQFCFPLLSLAVLTFLSSFAGMLLLAHLEMTNENFDSLPTARRELRGGGRSTSNEPEPEFFLFLQVAFMILPTIAAIIGTCIYYNKSQNTAPWNGESVQSYPSNKTAVAVPAQQMQILQVQCPAGSKGKLLPLSPLPSAIVVAAAPPRSLLLLLLPPLPLLPLLRVVLVVYLSRLTRGILASVGRTQRVTLCRSTA
eukprot:COSAG03_NODE_26_length_19032_cov_87.110812_10_plen_197_part_00